MKRKYRMSKRSKTTVSRQIRKVSSASYKAYYGITLIETLMSVGLLGVVLLPLLMTSTAYLSTKVLNNRTNSELSQNVNALGAKLNTLAASTTGINHLTSTTTNLEMRIKNSTGARRIFQYSIIGAPGAQRLREFQGSTGNFTSTAAMRSLNEDSITLVGNTGFVYCNDTTCTVPTNTAAQNQAIARTAETVVFDGNTTTNVVRVGSGVVTGAEPVGLVFNAGDNSRKRGVLPTNIFGLGTDSVTGSNATIMPNPTVVTNTDPDGVLNVFTKAQVYGTPTGGLDVDADLRLATGSGSSFMALPLANATPVNPVAPTLTTTARYSRIYKEGKGTTTTGNVRPILPNFRLDQTVADSYQGNMCFSGTQQVQGFQVYYWNRTMSQAALTSVQSASTVADPFTVTPECAGASSGYGVYDNTQGRYYIDSTAIRKKYGTRQTYTKIAPSSYTRMHYDNSNDFFKDVSTPGTEQYAIYRSWETGDTGIWYNSNLYYFTGGIIWENRSWIGNAGGIKAYYYIGNNIVSQTVPSFDYNPNPTGITSMSATGQNQWQSQPITDNGNYVLVHDRLSQGLIDVPVNLIDPNGGNQISHLYNRAMRNFNIYGNEGGLSYGDCTRHDVPSRTTKTRYQVCNDLTYPRGGGNPNAEWWSDDPKSSTITRKVVNYNVSVIVRVCNGPFWRRRCWNETRVEPRQRYVYESQRNKFLYERWKKANVKRYLNTNPTSVNDDTINLPIGASAPFIMRDNTLGHLFYSKVAVDGSNMRLYSFSPTDQQVVAGPLVNMDWGDVAATRLAASKRVLSYSSHNKVAVTGNTSGYGNVSAWYYDNVDQPVATLKTGGVGFNAAQANSTNVNYIADPTSTFNAYQTNLTAVTSEGSTLYTLNSVTGTLTRYVTRIGQYNHVRQSETRLTSGIVNASSAIAVSPMDDGLYLLDAGNRTVRYYADRRSISITPPQAVARSFSTSQATLPTGLAVSKVTGLVYVLDSTLGTVTVDTTVTRTLNIHVYNPNGAFIETLALDVSDNQFVNATDRLVPQSGQIMRLTLGEKQSQFYVHVETAGTVSNPGRTYQFGVDRQI
jgi:hypothetical protein